VPSQKAECCSVNTLWTYFFSPAGPGRGVVSSNPATAEAVIRVRISATTVRSASSIVMPMRATRCGGSDPSSRMVSLSDRALTSSMTIHERPSATTRSWMVTIPGWFSRVAARFTERPPVPFSARIGHENLFDRDVTIQDEVAVAET
jgi:hypothetical protein